MAGKEAAASRMDDRGVNILNILIEAIAGYFVSAAPIAIFIGLCTRLAGWLFDGITGKGGFR